MENNWSGSRESRKRSLTEMSQSHTRTLSSSPVLFRERPSNLSSSSRLPPLANITATSSSSSRERRRTPNLHNPPGQSSRTSQSLQASAEMEANPRAAPVQRRSEVIDLTSDQDDVPSPEAPPRRANRMHASPRPPPRLGRSEARLEQVVDLTADDDDDDDDTIVITHSRERSIPQIHHAQRLPPPLPRLYGHLGRMDQPGGRATPPGHRYGNADGNNHMEPPRPQPGRAVGGLRAFYENGADIIMDLHNYMGFGRANYAVDDQGGARFFADFPAMPNAIGMDYARVALQDQKPDHVAPPPVEDGFTRSPTETDTAICPSCEEELVHRKDATEEPPAKKSRGAPSRKDREEHPFWVVKDCGHVFCNKCYQNRANNKISSFRGSKSILLCAVEDCASIVKNKDRWIGVFL